MHFTIIENVIPVFQNLQIIEPSYSTNITS